MQHRTIVLPEYLNDQGFLFGGNLLKWVDEFAYITASLEYPGNRFVTISLDQVNFQQPVLPGEILRFEITCQRKGTTSLQYHVEVTGEKLAGHSEPLFVTNITFVNVGCEGKPIVISEAWSARLSSAGINRGGVNHRPCCWILAYGRRYFADFLFGGRYIDSEFSAVYGIAIVFNLL